MRSNLWRTQSASCANPVETVDRLLVMVVITVSSVITVMAATRDVNLTYNGETYTLQTTSGGTQDILNQAKAQYPEIEVGPMDDISRSEDETAINLTVKSAYDATVFGGRRRPHRACLLR